ncbi:MAG: segregation and condensation protein A [Pseudomonadota bacterium]
MRDITTNTDQSDKFMSSDTQASKEQRTLLVMRKLLASIVRESTPKPGMRHVLSENTRNDIRMAFELISARERELAEDAGIEIKERPRYPDQPKTSSVISIDSLKNKPPTSDT